MSFLSILFEVRIQGSQYIQGIFRQLLPTSVAAARISFKESLNVVFSLLETAINVNCL
jgi:hypothetical protein